MTAKIKETIVSFAWIRIVDFGNPEPGIWPPQPQWWVATH